MSYLELPYTDTLVRYGELKEMIKSIKSWEKANKFYATVLHEPTERWKKIEKLCYFIGMEKILNHNKKLYGTSSVFVTSSLTNENRQRLLRYYSDLNLKGHPKSPVWRKKHIKTVLIDSDKVCQKLLKEKDVTCIYKSPNCVAFDIPSTAWELLGINYVEFFTKCQLKV